MCFNGIPCFPITLNIHVHYYIPLHSLSPQFTLPKSSRLNVEPGDYLGWYDEGEDGVFGYQDGGLPVCLIGDMKKPRQNSDVVAKVITMETLVTRSYSVQACYGRD